MTQQMTEDNGREKAPSTHANVVKLFKDVGDDEHFRVINKPGIWKIFIPNKMIKYVIRIDIFASAQTMDPNTEVCTCLPDDDPRVVLIDIQKTNKDKTDDQSTNKI